MIKIGVICPSEIAFRRFMPALAKAEGFDFVGLGVCNATERFGDKLPSAEIVDAVLKQENEKAQSFVDVYGGKIYKSYREIASSDEIDALYIPLPPALHFHWAKIALEHGKHVLIEKPSTIAFADTKALVGLAKKSSLALHENYMFIFHDQLKAINELVVSGEIGDVRLYNIKFGFPQRAANDFRYNKALGGGALIDAGGYTIKYATKLLGKTARIACAQMNYTDEFDVDIYGSATMVNDAGVTVQLAFGMDNNYKCELEVWGSKGSLTTNRVLTAPAGFVSQMMIRKGNEDEFRDLPADDAFLKSILRFKECIENETIRKENYSLISKQAELIDQFKKLAGS
ncbi:Gfo/Idh/MocA family protein [Pelosinus sp. sgz500959]|uniref:Gfo/Idh/MocA family protein n=1 Tax=Pelosinus sp. sgz500959 TaxID=3242472 RepID=UPI00366F79B3